MIQEPSIYMMSKEQVNAIMAKSAEYVAKTQPQLDKLASDNHKFEERAIKTAAILANRGVIAFDKVDTFAEKLAEDKTVALDYLEKVASVSSVDSLGGPADASLAKVAEDKSDPFQRILAPETISRENFMNL